MKYPVYDCLDSARRGELVGFTKSREQAQKILAAHYEGTSWEVAPNPVLTDFNLCGREMKGWVDQPRADV